MRIDVHRICPAEANADPPRVRVRRDDEVVFERAGRPVEDEIDAAIDAGIPHGVVRRNVDDVRRRIVAAHVVNPSGQCFPRDSRHAHARAVEANVDHRTARRPFLGPTEMQSRAAVGQQHRMPRTTRDESNARVVHLSVVRFEGEWQPAKRCTGDRRQRRKQGSEHERQRANSIRHDDP